MSKCELNFGKSVEDAGRRDSEDVNRQLVSKSPGGGFEPFAVAVEFIPHALRRQSRVQVD